MYIEGEETYYFVNKNGEIKSEYSNKILSPSYNKARGYYYVYLRLNGKTYTKALHRVIAETLISNPNNFTEVNHIDGNKKNNKVENLEWCSKSYNIKHAYEHGLTKASVEQIKRPVFQYSLDNEYINKFETLKEAAESLGKKNGGPNIGKVCSGKRETAYGYKWKYVDDRGIWYEV